MAGNYKRRKRSVDVNALSRQQADRLEKEIGKQLGKIFDEAGTKANKMLNIYGLQIKIGYQIVEMTNKKDKNDLKKEESLNL